MFISNNDAPFRLWRKQTLVKHQRVSKYYEDDCLQNFPLHHISEVKANFVKNSHIYSRIYLIFLENVLKQTSNVFNTEFLP